mmetsp:Transcript_23724/g.67004  ORF Transcript_23724/g.67004 Transcript_23724/m.67004 type:complete len:241 (-) Transcript_23724:1117-1839(-)
MLHRHRITAVTIVITLREIVLVPHGLQDGTAAVVVVVQGATHAPHVPPIPMRQEADGPMVRIVVHVDVGEILLHNVVAGRDGLLLPFVLQLAFIRLHFVLLAPVVIIGILQVFLRLSTLRRVRKAEERVRLAQHAPDHVGVQRLHPNRTDGTGRFEVHSDRSGSLRQVRRLMYRIGQDQQRLFDAMEQLSRRVQHGVGGSIHGMPALLVGSEIVGAVVLRRVLIHGPPTEEYEPSHAQHQ